MIAIGLVFRGLIGFSFYRILSEPICAIGLGVAALCSAMSMDGRTWMLREYSMTAVSLINLSHSHFSGDRY